MRNDKPRRPGGRWDPREILYDLVLERPLTAIRRKVVELVTGAGLFPLVDICCGPGNQLRRLARRADGAAALPAVGLDISLRGVRYAAARAPGVSFVCGDGTALPFRAGAFRAALLSFALHEQEPEVRRRLLAAAGEAVGPGGRLILVDFENPWNSKSRLAHASYITVTERVAGRDHLRLNRDFHRRGGLRALLAGCGLEELVRQDVGAGCCAIVVAARRP